MRSVFKVLEKLPGLSGRKSLEQQVEDAKTDIFKAQEFQRTKETPGYRYIVQAIEEMEAEVDKALSNEHISDKDLRHANIQKAVIADLKGRFLLIETRGTEARTKLKRIGESNNGR